MDFISCLTDEEPDCSSIKELEARVRALERQIVEHTPMQVQEVLERCRRLEERLEAMGSEFDWKLAQLSNEPETETQGDDGLEQPYIERKPYVCNLCPEEAPDALFTSAADLKEHHATQHMISTQNSDLTADANSPSTPTTRLRSHFCVICSKKFNRRYHLKRHIAAKHPEHSGHPIEDPPPPALAEIPEDSTTFPEGEAEGAREGTPRRFHKCPQCVKSFDRFYHLTRHISSKHKPPSFRCEFCPKLFSLRYKLRRHQKEVHNQISESLRGPPERPRRDKTAEELRNFMCDTCGTTYKKEEHLVVHKRRHTGERPFTCSHAACGRTFTSKPTPQMHTRLHMGKQFICDECGRGFTRKSVLNAHKQSHAEGTVKTRRRRRKGETN